VPARVTPVGFFAVMFSGEMCVSQLVTHFTGDGLAILDCNNEIIRGAAEMLADGRPIFGNNGNFHQ
jgi:hypothetical protein